MGSARLFSYIGLFAMVLGCSEQQSPTPAATYGGRGRVASTQGGAVVMTYDERIAVVANRTAGVVSVLALDPTRSPNAMVRRTTQIDVGPDAKPWAAVIGADDDTAYVLLRGSQTVVRLSHLHDRPSWEPLSAVPVGAEPTSIAITPSGAQLYIANFGDGTVSMITTADLVAHQYTNLNLTVAKSGLLGSAANDAPSAGTSALGMWTDAELGSVRPGLAHPRALAMTDNGDNDDAGETLYVTDFFALPRPGAPAGDPDLSRQGVVYAIDIDSGQVKTQIPLAPLATGLSDATGSMTSCFPNQLYAATVTNGRLYVTSVCASPRGPTGAGPKDPNNPALATANFKTLVHAAVSVVDTAQNVELGSASGVLTKPLIDLYDANPGVTDRRMPLIPNDVALGSGANGEPTLYVSALGADAVFAVGVAGDVLRPDPAFIDLRPAGHLPVGVALSRTAEQPFALVMNDYSNGVTVIGLDAARPSALAPSAPQETVLSDLNEGHRVFATGLDVWSLGGQAWSSCESCHPEGLSDGVTWQFARGPRRTISTAGTYTPDGRTRRLLLWTANVDEIHDVEAIARGVSGGIGSVLWNTYTPGSKPNNDCRLLFDGAMASPVGGVEACPAPEPTSFRLNGMNGALSAITRPAGDSPCTEDTTPCDLNDSRAWDHMDEFIRSVKAPHAPKTCTSNAAGKSVLCLNSDYVAAGRELFVSRGCAACHGGPNFTISRLFFTPGHANNGKLPFAAPGADAVDPAEADLGVLRGRLRMEKYEAGALAAVNPPAAASGSAFFRSYAPAVGTTSTRPALDYLYGTADTINCALRAVGTFPAQAMGEPANFGGIVAEGAPAVTESRVQLVNPPADAAPGTLPTYQETLSLGKDGFNVPALVGMAATNSFFHAGNARTLEELFSITFAQHHANPAITKSGTLTAADTKNLVSYLLSLDDDAPTVTATFDSGTPSGADLCAAFKE